MIKYALKCDKGHGFDSWFPSAEKFDQLKSAGLLTCATCGSPNVVKAIMAPKLAARGALSETKDAVETKLAEMRKHVEENATYVGGAFAQEARDMHERAKRIARFGARRARMRPKP